MQKQYSLFGKRKIGYILPFLCALIFFTVNTASAQVWKKAYDFGTTSSSENALGVCSDAAGNFYFGGRFCQTVDFDPGAGTNNLSTEVGASTATQNTFLTKYDAAGNYVWAVQVGKSQSNVNVAFNGVATDGTYVYVTGIINDTATFGATTLYTNNADIYVAKYSAATGALIWVKKLGGTNADNAAGLCIDNSGGIYVSGNYATSTTMGSTTLTVTGGGSAADLFCVKLNASDGSVAWLVGGGGTGTDGSGGIGAIAYAPSVDRVVMGVVYNGATATFGSYSITNSGLNDVGILELNPSTGAFTSATNYGTAGNEFIFGADYDPATGDVFFAGNYENTVTIPGAGAMSSSGTSTSSLLATRYSTSAHTFVWGKAGNMVTGSGTGVNNAYRSVYATGTGSVYYGGSFNGNSSVTLTLSGSTVLTGSGNVDIVLTRYAVDDGRLEYATTTPGTGGSEVPFSLSGNTRGLLAVAGQNSSTLTLGSLSISTAGTLDILIAFQTIPSVTTANPTSITGSSVVLGGEAIDSSGLAVTDRGVVYATTAFPTTASTKVSMGTGTGVFSQTVTGLTAAATYYVRAFMTSSGGTFYGMQDTFVAAAASNTPPTFTNGSPQTLTVCQNAAATSLNNLLKVNDADAGQTLTWTVTSAASHGTLAISYNTTSTGSTVTPTGLTYTPTAGYSGSDAFTVQVSDGTATASTTVNVTVNAAPTAFTLTGGGAVCPGSTGTSIGLAGSATGVNYQLYNGASPEGSPVAGTGSAISFGSTFTAAGTYTVVATNATTNCTANMTGSAVITTATSPTAYSVTGGGSFCSGGSGVAVGLAGSQIGKRYQLYVGASTSGSPVFGTGSSITFGNKTTGGTYTVVATDTATLCTANMTGSVTVTVNPLPTITLGTSPSVVSGATSASLPYTATTNSPTTYTITWSATALGAGFTNISTPAALPSSPISITVPASAPANTYVAAIRVQNATCNSSSVIFTVTVGASNTPPTFTNGSPQTLTVCQNAAATAINDLLKVNDANSGQTLTWTITSAASHGTVAAAYNTTSTGSTVTPTGLTYTPTAGYSGSDAFTVQVSDGTATASTTVNVTVNAAPTAFTLTGGGAVCPGSTGTSIGLAGSATGVNYQLYNGASPEGSPVAGTGSAISFGSTFTAAGTYTVVATNATTNCTATMTGSAVITTATAPTAYSVTGGGSFCSGGSGVAVGLASSQTGKRYQLYVGASTSGSPVLGTGSSITFGNKTTGGTYTVVATDTATLCTANMTGSVTVTVNPLPTITLGTSPSVISGATSASLPYTATTNSPTTYTITWSATALGAGFTNISTPAALPSSPISITVPASAPANTYVAAIRVQNATCNSSSVIFTVTVNPANVAPTFTNGSPQTLTVCANAAATSLNNLLKVNDADAGQTLTWTVTSAAAHGTVAASYNTTSTGSTVTPTGLTYTPTAGYSGSDAFTVQVSDGTATASTTVNVTVTAPVSGSTVVTNVACNGNSTGAINLTPSGGTPGYTFNWNGGTTTEDRTGLAAGSYSVIITDANNCKDTVDAIITQPSALNATASMVTNIACNGGSTGAIDISVSGGVSGYTYLWNGGATTQDRTGIPAGSYTVIVTDANDCKDTVTTVVTQPPVLNASAIAVTNIACNGGSTGAIDISVSGGASGYTYMWNGGATTQDRTGIPAGSYTVIVTDANDCKDTVTTVVTQPPVLNANAIAVTNVACNGGSTGAIDISVSGGASGYTYLWNGGATTQDRTGIPAGSYTVIVTDANDCKDTVTTVVTQPPVLNANAIAVTNVACNGGSTGAIDISVSGGVSGYTYIWNGGATTQDRTGIPAGSYTVIVTDANDCKDTVITTVTQPPALNANAIAVTNIACNGGSTGAIDISVSGGVSGYTYMWNGGATTQDRTGIPAGSYTVIVTDANDCKDTVTTVVTQPPVLNASAIAVTNIACNGGSTGAIDISVSGGVSGYTYLWNGGATTQDRTGIPAGSYTVIVTDANDCKDTVTTIVTQPSALSASAVVTNLGCFGDNTGAIDLTPTGGTPGYTYVWTGGVTTQDRTGIPAGSYTVIVTDANSCKDTVDAIVTQPADIVLQTVTGGGAYCAGAGGKEIALSGSETGVNYQLYNGINTVGAPVAGTGSIISFGNQTVAGTYTVVAKNATTNCVKNMSGSVAIIVNPIPDVNATTDRVLCNTANLSAIAFTGAVGGTTYTWTNNTTSIGLAASGTGNIGSFAVANNTNAPVTSTVMVTPSASGCIGTPDTFTITVNPTPGVLPTGDQTLCNAASTTSVNFSGAVSGTTYAWVNNNTSIGLAASGSGNIGSFAAVNSTNAPVTATVIVTPSANGCGGTHDTFTIRVNPTPSVSAVTDQSLCTGTNTIAVNFSGFVPSSTYTWTNNTTSIGLAASGTGNIASFGAINNGNTPVTSTIIVTPSKDGCIGSTATFAITVKPRPNVVATADQTVCNAAPTSEVGFTGAVAGTVYSWSNSNTSVGLAAGSSGNIASFTAINTGNTAATARVIVIPSANGCIGTSDTFTINVNPTPILSATSDQTLCDKAATAVVNFSSTVASTAFGWLNNNTTIGLGPDGNGNIASFIALNAGVNNTTANIIVTPTAAGCVGARDTFTITVKPTPTVSAIGSQVLCNTQSTSPVTFAGAVSGTSYAWINNTTSVGLAASGTGNIGAFTAANTGTTPVTATVIVTPSANGCTGASDNFTYTVNPTPTVNTVAGQTLCNTALTTAVNFSGAVSGTSYAWINNTTSVGLAAGGSGNVAPFVAANTGTTPVTATVTVTPSANGCTGASKTFGYTVNPTPVVNAITNQTLCNTVNTTPVVFSGAVSGTSYAWTNNNTTVGLSASGTGNISAFAAANTGTVPVTALVTVTPSANTCVGSSKTFTYTVNPTPSVNVVSNQTLCNAAPTSPVVFSGSVSGTSYAWTNNTTSIGLGASGTGNIASFTAANSGNIPVTASLTVVPSAAGCIGSSKVFNITVNPTPTVASVANQTLCNTALTNAVTFTGAVTGTTYAWVNTNPSVGLSATGLGNIASFAATNTGNTPATGVVTVTPSANGCNGNTGVFSYTVNPTPTVNTITDQVICNSATVSAVNFTGSVTGTAYAWSNTNTSIGLGSAGTGNIAAFTATNSGNIPVATVVTVTPSANGCVGAPKNFGITVNPTPVVNSIANQAVCHSTSTVDVNFTGSVSGTTYTWSNDNTSIGLAASGVGNIPAFTGVNTTNTPATGLITVTPSANACVGTAQAFFITVNPIPTVNPVANSAYCDGTSSSLVAFSGSVSGTTYAWSNSNTSIGLPASGVTAIGSFGVTNTGVLPVTANIDVVPSANGCVGPVRSFTITAKPIPAMTSTANPAPICDDATFNYTPTSATPGTSFAWSRAVVSGISNPAASGANNPGEILNNTTTAPVNTIYRYTLTADGCSDVFDVNLRVNPTPVLNTALSGTICSGAEFTYTPGSAVQGTSFQWVRANVSGITPATSNGVDGIAETLFNTTTAPVNAIYRYTLTANGCTNDENVTVLVNHLPAPVTVSIKAAEALCANTKLMNFGADVPAPAGQYYIWTATNAEIANTGLGSQNILVNFPTPGESIITLITKYSGTGCENNSSTIKVNVGTDRAPDINVTYRFDRFVCLRNDMDKYTWGYDDKTTLDSVVIPGEHAQDFILNNPDLQNRYYWVITEDEGCVQKSYFNAPTGITSAMQTRYEMKLYPNPATEVVIAEMELPDFKDVQATMYDITGRLLHTAEVTKGKVRFDVAHLPSGVYTVECRKEGIRFAVAKFIKN